MGLPTNQAKGQGCNPVSSNCVIWQGPDIPCIDLCHGDSITDVTAKLAKELCDILDTLNIDTYDLTCFKPICPDPKDFHDLIQFLITKVCELQCCCDGTTPAQSACPDTCIVNVAPCFYFQNQLGDTITTMTLPEYVTAIGNKICTMAGQIGTLQQQVAALQNQQTITDNRVVILEDEIAGAIVTIPSSARLGPAPPGGWPIATVVEAIDTDLSELEAATGSPIELLQSIQQQCTNMDALKTLANRQQTYSGLNGWVTQTNYNSVADAINNLWLSFCDMRSAVENILATCCCTDCDDVDISFTATLTGEPASLLNLFFTGSIPTGLTDCFPDGNLVTVTDANGGQLVTFVPIVSNLNSSVQIDLTGTPVNPATDLTITIQGCWNRPAPGSDCGGLRCERVLTYIIINTAPCPVLVLVPSTDDIAYSFTNGVSGNVTYTIELYTAANVFVSSQSSVNPVFLAAVAGIFTGLTGGTNYYIQVSVNINGTIKICPQAFISTLPVPCIAPTGVSAAKP